MAQAFPRHILHGVLFFWGTCIFCIPCVPAFAREPSPAELSVAKHMLREAIAEQKAGKCDDAIAILEQVLAIVESSEALMLLGECKVEKGLLREGLAAFERADQLAVAQQDRARGKELPRKIEELRGRIPTVRIELVSRGAATLVELDGKPVPLEQLSEPIPVDPGEHVVEARASGGAMFSKKISLAEKEASTVLVDLLEQRGPKDGGFSPPLTAWIAGGAALALAAGGTVTFIVAGSEAQGGAEACAKAVQCDAKRIEAVRRLDGAALGFWISAGIAAGASMTLLAFAPSPSRPDSAFKQPAVKVLVSSNSVLVHGMF